MNEGEHLHGYGSFSYDRRLTGDSTMSSDRRESRGGTYSLLDSTFANPDHTHEARSRLLMMSTITISLSMFGFGLATGNIAGALLFMEADPIFPGLGNGRLS